MVKSMTGYGRAVETVDGREITVEIRSVNNRYLDCSVKLPRLYAFAEDALKQRVRQSVSRGKVDVYVTVNVTQSNHVKISLNRPLLEGYLQAMRTAAADYGVKDDISVTALTSMPDVLVVEKEAEDEKQMTQALLSVTEKALEAYNAMRLTEGRALEEDLRRKGKNILALVEKVEQRSPITVAEYRARLTAKMEEVLESTAVD